jgi:hypothetical protein
MQLKDVDYDDPRLSSYSHGFKIDGDLNELVKRQKILGVHLE